MSHNKKPGRGPRTTEAKTAIANAGDLRARAELASKNKADGQPLGFDALTPEAARRMLQELSIHRIELEMQNEQLRQSQLELEAERARYLNLYNLAPVGYITTDAVGIIRQANLTAANLMGLTQSTLAGRPFHSFLSKADADSFYRLTHQFATTAATDWCELRILRTDLSTFWAHIAVTAGRDADDHFILRIVLSDISERKLLELHREHERKVLELLAGGKPQTTVFTQLVLGYEQLFPGMRGSLLLLAPGGKHLVQGASPNLPQAFRDAIDGMEIGPQNGACGRAASTGKNMIVDDIATDPLTVKVRALALCLGLRACWSVPIFGITKRVLGTFAFYFDSPRLASTSELDTIQRGAHLASVAIERHLDQAALNNSVEYTQALIRSMHDGLSVLDTVGTHVDVNPALCRMTGFTREELLNPETPFPYWAPEGYARCQAAVEQTIGGNPADFELTFMRRSGERFPALVSAAAVRNTDGQVVQYAATIKDITDRKRAEQLVREAEQFQRSAIDAMDAHTALLDSDGRVLSANRAWRDFGAANGAIGSDAHLGANYLSVCDQAAPECEDAARVAAAIRAVLADTNDRIEPPPIEYPCHSPTERRWFLCFIRGFSRGDSRFAVVLHQNITALRLAEEHDREHHEMLQTVLDSSPMGIWMQSPDGRMRFVNKTFCITTGFTEEKYLSRPYWDLLDAETAEGCIKSDQIAMAQASPYTAREKVLFVDGLRHDVEVTKVRMLDEQGRFVGIIGQSMDITERLRAERLTSESERRFRTLADSAPMLVWTSGRDANRNYFNKPWLDFTGRSLEQELGDGWTQSLHPDDLDRYWSTYTQAHESRQPFETEYRLKRIDGTYRAFMSRGVPRTSDEGTFDGLVGACVDVTELREAHAKAEAASRTKSEFLANMSHEIRTPLTAILGFTEILREDGDLSAAPAHRVEALDTITSAGKHLLTIINDILDLSKIEAGKMTVERIAMSPDAILGDAESLVKEKARAKGLTLAVVRQTPLPAIIASDPVRLKQILVNLLGNAIKFTQAGKITVSVSLQPGTAAAAPYLRFDITDTGIGLTPAQIDTLFGAFQQADSSTTRKFGGSGLGLRISRSLARMLGGDVTVASEPGRGSTFTATISASPPLATATATTPQVSQRASFGPTAQTRANHTSALPLAGLCIFLAEDGPDNQRLIALHLTKAGATLQLFNDGLLCLKALTTTASADGPLHNPPPCDLLLADMQMPEMDGYTLARTLRQRGSTLPIVALTANAMAEDRATCLAAGCNDYATKPIDRQQLLEKCAAWARKATDTAAPTNHS